MKPRLTLKHILIATIACVLITLVDVISYAASSVHLFNPRDFKPIFYWLILFVGWFVYFLDSFKKK